MQLAIILAGLALVAVGIIVFVRAPHSAGGSTKIKLPGIEAELPVASLLPMVLGVALLLTASQVPDGQASEQKKETPAPSPVASIASEPVPVKPNPPPACVGATSVTLVALRWAPTDCMDQPGAPVRIDGCAEKRPLSWLKQRLEALRNAKLEGYRELPSAFELRIADAYGKKGWALHVMSGDERLYNVGVGYNVKSGAKDGCLSLVRNGALASSSVCMDTSGGWWERRGQELCFVAP